MGVDNHYYLGYDWKVNWKLNESVLLQKIQFLLFYGHLYADFGEERT